MRCVSTGSPSQSDSRSRAERLIAAGKNVYLAGFMGTGKTATARAIARTLGVPWVDLDEVIVRAEGLSVAEIFAQRGERAFRNAEHRALKAVLAGAGSVVALGGGAVCFERNRALLRGTGPVVLLTAPAETILKRVGRSPERPLLAGPDAPATDSGAAPAPHAGLPALPVARRHDRTHAGRRRRGGAAGGRSRRASGRRGARPRHGGPSGRNLPVREA